jgi:hypothetical protein
MYPNPQLQGSLNFQYSPGQTSNSPDGPNLYLFFSVVGTRKAEQKDDAGVDKQYSSKSVFTYGKQKVASH